MFNLFVLCRWRKSVMRDDKSLLTMRRNRDNDGTVDYQVCERVMAVEGSVAHTHTF